jgi:hypothetical protein
MRALIALALVAAAPALAQDDKVSAQPPERMVTLVVFGDDPCPRSSNEEIVVCARLPENERYRIPKRFRGKKSWVSRARELEYVSRAGTPNSCSPVGSGGQTGCFSQFLRQAREERRQTQAEGREVP